MIRYFSALNFKKNVNLSQQACEGKMIFINCVLVSTDCQVRLNLQGFSSSIGGSVSDVKYIFSSNISSQFVHIIVKTKKSIECHHPNSFIPLLILDTDFSMPQTERLRSTCSAFSSSQL